MKKFYLLSLLLFTIFSSSLLAQMHRVIRSYNGTVAQPILHYPNNNTASRITSCSVDTILLTTQTQINNFATTYPTCTTPKYLIINGLGASPTITSLAGLSSITQVINKLEIRNTSITSLAALNNITSIGDSMLLERNNALTTIGLTNLIQLGAIYFSHLPLLNSVAGLCNNFHKTGLVYIDSTNLSNLTGLNTLDTLTTSNGAVTISNTPIINVAALNNLKQMDGYIKMSNNPLQSSIGLTNIKFCWGFLIDGLPLLNSVAGLTNNLTSGNIGTFWVINTGLPNLTGLQGITGTSNFYINGNPNLTDISALQNLKGDIGSGFSIYGNPLLTSIAALSNITGVMYDGSVEIQYNGITTLNGLQNILNINKGLYIVGNSNLTTLSALNSKLVIHNNKDSYNGNFDNVNIHDNPQLSICSDTAICNYLNSGGVAFINNNAVGCNTVAEVQASCGPGINYNDLEDNCCIYNAIPTAQGQTKYGNVGHYIGRDAGGNSLYDDYDTYQIIMPYYGSFKLFVTAKNDSSCFENRSTDFNVDMLDKNSNVFQYKTFFNWNINDACNLIKTDSFKFRGYAADTFYLRLHGDKITYSFYWQALDSCSTDAEPNNTAATAILINPLQIKKGTVFFKKTANQNDYDDYYKTILPVSGNIDVYIKITNRENALPYQTNRFSLSWGYIGSGNNYYFTNTNYVALPSVDNIIYDTIHICGVANDTQYFRIRSLQEGYEYELNYKITDTLANDLNEPNNNFATATPINVNQLKQGNLRFSGTVEDNDDYYRTVIPQNGFVKILVQANTLKCNAGNIILYGYDKLQNQIFVKPIATNIPIPASTTVYDTIIVCGQPTDTFYFRFNSYAPFQYQFRYIMQDTIPNVADPEPNNTFATATPINELDSITATIKFPQGAGTDDYDYYRTILPKDGTIKIFVQAKNYDCNNAYLYLTGYDRRQASGQIFANYISNNNNVAPAQTIYDTLLICGRASDSFYLRFEASGKFVYNFKYQMVDTSANDVEPNNNFATALPIAENQTKAGHINYYSNGGADTYDYYKTLLPKDGTLKIIVQSTNMGCVYSPYIRVTGFDKRQDQGQIFAQYLANNTNIAPGQTVYDTILICGRAADSLYVKFEANTAFKYQWSYAMIDTSANDVEPNNNFAQATAVGSAQTKYGHIKYRSNGGYDDLDYYKFVFSNTDSLKIKIQAINKSCSNGEYMSLQVFDKNFTQLISRYISTNVAAGQTIYDSIKMLVNAPDTIYLRLDASSSFQYQFTTNPRQPSDLFSIAGDSTVCFGTKTYKAINVVDDNVVYHWALSGGGTLNFTDSIATVNWNANGTQNLSLYLSNIYGNSSTKQKNIIVNNNAPTDVPVLVNFARTLSTNNLPSGTVCKWFNNGVEIAGVTDSIYYAQDSGTYTVHFVRPCGTGPASNSFYFPLPAQAQNIAFTHTANIIFSPSTKAKLTATASSGLSVTFQLISGNASIVGDAVSVTSAGTVIVKAIQPGSNIYAAAPAKFDTIIVVQGPQTITFNTIPAQIFSASPLALTATASSGLAVSYNIISGNATISGSNIIFTGAGNVTVQANQSGNADYTAASPLQQTFCIGIRSLSAIAGSVSPCLNNYVYTTDKIPSANYVWTLSSGGTITTNNDTAFINWTTQGTHTITVKANSTCDTVYSNIVSLNITTANNAPTPVTNMLPINSAINQQLPLVLSWQPGLYSVNYDLYVWDSAMAQPALPYAANINMVNFTLPQNSFVYNKAYKWRIVSKNPCLYTAGPVQQFRLVPLPDIAVTQVLAPLTAFSGQTISINWTVKNNGPGRTQTNQSWSDAVYLSFDTLPSFKVPPETNPGGWSQLQFPVRPLLIGTRPNVTALDSGQVYNNSLSFTLPVNYSLPVYVYVITNSPANANLPEVTYANDTARAAQPIFITLSPTPDLRVDTVFTPASIFSGNTVNVTYKVKNYGVVTPPGVNWYDKFYISPTAVFNSSNAVELFPANANGRYYNCGYNFYTGIAHTTQLNADSSYTNAVQLVIPNFILGTYFIHVKTNNTASLYEGAFINNNTNSNQIQVYLTPTPVLDIASLTLQSNNVSTTQNIGVNWNINNSGFYDNKEKNQGHYAKQGAYCASFITGYTNPGNQPITAPGYLYTDSISWGSSYWNDKIYLSRDSGTIETANLIFLNKFNHGVENNAVPCNDYYNTCLSGSNYDRNIFNIIKPTFNYPSAVSINIPDTLSVGNYYLYVVANADKTVYEYPNNNRYKRSGIITVNRPDLTPPIVSVQPNTNAGVPITVNYTISNGGLGNVYNHLRRDKFYVSPSPIFTGGAIQIGSQNFTENVLVNSPVTHSFTYTFPPGTPTSARYFYVLTNYDSAFKETNMTNNLSAAAAINVTIAVAKDLIVSAVQLPANSTDTVFTITNVPLKYTVVNNGNDSIINKTWVDSIFVSCTPSFNSSTAFYLARRMHSNVLAAGENYTDSFNIVIPKFSYELNNCFGLDNTIAYFFVRTNADTGVYEGANMINNYTSSIQKKLINPYIDLIVTNVGGADTATVARNYTANWSTKNIKYFTAYGYNGYYDGVYFSPDSVFNANAVEVAGSTFGKYDDRQLGTNQTSSSSQTFILPNISAGDYYVHVKTNKFENLIAEKNISNNTNLIRNGIGAAKKIHVNATPLPDITASLIVAPTLLAVGQSYNVKYKIKNEGTGVSYPNYMNTAVYLSTTTQPVGLVLQQTAHNNPLQVDSSYTDSVTVNIPINTITGNYVLVINADNNNYIIESNKTNNVAYKYVTVYSPAPSDLIVQNVSHPDSVFLGYTIDSLKWIVRNNSSNAAQGISSDGMYLSATNILDSTATLIGIKNKTINMLPLANDTLQAQPLVTNVTEGSYKVFIKTDLLNNIVETNKDNNVGSPSGNIYVKVKQLPLNMLTPNTLGSIPRYYKLIIPDSLNGSTILVSLKSNDSLTSTNQMYIGKGFIPSAAHFDYQYDKPNYGNQDIIITSVAAGNYYITTTKITATNPIQTISLKAVKLPFAVLNVQSSSGGNTGNVTVKISGSLFSNNMVAKLIGNTTTITASAVYFVNTTSVFATFNLAGNPLGIYDVTLTKPDTTIAALAGGFSIVPANNGGLITGGGTNGIPGNGNNAGCDPNAPSGLNAQLVAEIVLPPKVFGGWPFVIQINYSNPTNVDIAAQTRILYCINGFPIAFTAAGLANAGSSIYLELTEPGGPPGIIRAGGSGTITLYSKAPVTFPAHNYGNYILK